MREAHLARQNPVLVMYDPETLRTDSGRAFVRELEQWTTDLHEVTAHVLNAAAQTETPSGVLAVIRRPSPPPLETHESDGFAVVLDGMGDPGNVGTILRTADAAGVDFVALTPQSADPFNPKAVRAGMGAHFRLDIYAGVPLVELLQTLPGMQWVTIDAGSETDMYHFVWPVRCGLVIGGEAHGLSREARDNFDFSVRIPMRHGVESLNAAVAASIAIYAALGSRLSADL